jgi:uncharacterized protein YbcI
MPEPESQRGHADGRLNSAVSNAIVHLVREYTGRGPTRAQTHISGDLVSVVMADALTKAERSLVDDGKGETVRSLRQEFQRTMRKEMVSAVESLTGRKVIAFMSDNHIEPDMAIEAFVLEPRAEVH